MVVPSTMRTPPAGAAGREPAPEGAAASAAALAIGPGSCQPEGAEAEPPGATTHGSDPRCAPANSALPMRPNYGRGFRAVGAAQRVRVRNLPNRAAFGGARAGRLPGTLPSAPAAFRPPARWQQSVFPCRAATSPVTGPLAPVRLLRVPAAELARVGVHREPWQTPRQPGRAAMPVTEPAPRRGPPRPQGLGLAALARRAGPGLQMLAHGTTTAGALRAPRMRRAAPLRLSGRGAVAAAACEGEARSPRNGRPWQRRALRGPMALILRWPRARPPLARPAPAG